MKPAINRATKEAVKRGKKGAYRPTDTGSIGMTKLDMMAIRHQVNLYRGTMDHRASDHKRRVLLACEIIDELLAEVEKWKGKYQFEHDTSKYQIKVNEKAKAKIKELEKNTHLLEPS